MPAVEFRRLVLPLDGSRLAETALPWARLIAQRTQAEVDLVTSVHKVATPPEQALDHDASESHQWVGQQLNNWGVTYYRLVLTGEPAMVVRNVARKSGTGLIVMATHGRSGIGRKILGSVTDKVLHLSDVPVLVVRPGVETEEFEPKPPEALLVPLDGLEAGKDTLRVTSALGRIFDAKVVLFHSFSKTREYGRSSGSTIEEYMDRQAAELRELGLTTAITFTEGDPKHAIVKAQEELPKSIIVMASIGATGIGRSRRGSVADHVIHHACGPVVVVPPRGFIGPVLD